MVLKGLKRHDSNEGVKRDMMVLKGLKRRDGAQGGKGHHRTEGVKGT